MVPWVDRTLAYRLKRRFLCPIVFATKKSVGIRIDRRISETVGADRLVNALAGWERYRKPLIIVDFGTATTFDVIDAKGTYAGGAIAPGIQLANRSLYDYTAKLPRVEIAKTRRVICYTTKAAMQSWVCRDCRAYDHEDKTRDALKTRRHCDGWSGKTHSDGSNAYRSHPSRVNTRWSATHVEQPPFLGVLRE